MKSELLKQRLIKAMDSGKVCSSRYGFFDEYTLNDKEMVLSKRTSYCDLELKLNEESFNNAEIDNHNIIFKDVDGKKHSVVIYVSINVNEISLEGTPNTVKFDTVTLGN